MQRKSWLDVAILLSPSKVKGSQYLLIPKGLAQLLEIQDGSVLRLTIEEGNGTQRLVYSITEPVEQEDSRGHDEDER